jgi:hypothetical protein
VAVEFLATCEFREAHSSAVLQNHIPSSFELRLDFHGNIEQSHQVEHPTRSSACFGVKFCQSLNQYGQPSLATE